MDDLRRAYRSTVMIGLAAMASLVIFLIVVSVVPGGAPPVGQTGPVTESDAVFYVFLALSVLILAIIRNISSLILNSRGAQLTPVKRLQAAAIVTFALCEVPAVLGLVLSLLGRSRTDFYIFLLISLFLFSVHFPKFNQWEEWRRRQQPGKRPRRS